MRRLLASLSAAALLLYDRVGDGRDRAIEWSSLQLPGRPGDLAERATPLRREPRLRRSPLTRDVLKRLPPGIPVLPAIHDSAYISRAPQAGKTVFQVAPNSLAANEYRRLRQELTHGVD